jgi:predicted TIM-barrel fold metal-dependent hydrolase
LRRIFTTTKGISLTNLVAHRRAIMAGLAGVAVGGNSLLAATPDTAVPIIDTHAHLFDPRRPQGVPYSGPKGQPPQLALPEIYHDLAAPAGIVGTIVIEASAWIEDNLWILERAHGDPMFVGVVGHLQPDHPEYPQFLERFARDPLWRGIRFSQVSAMDSGRQILKPGMAAGLALLAQKDLSLDMANPSIALLRSALLVAEVVPSLRIIMDHVPQFDPPPEAEAMYGDLLAALARHPNFFIKLSQVIHPDNSGRIAHDLESYRPRLDRLISLFGADKVMFGSNWPATVGKATIAQSVSLMRAYFAGKPRIEAEKFFWKNSRAVYKWAARSTDQPV